MVTKTKQYSEEAEIAKLDWKNVKQLQKLFPLVDPENINLWSDPWEIHQLIKIQLREEVVRAILGLKRYKKLIQRHNATFENKIATYQIAHKILGDIQQELFDNATKQEQ